MEPMVVTGQKSPNCLEEGLIPVADTYLCLPDVYNPCLEEVIEMIEGRDEYGRFAKGSRGSPKTEFKKGQIPWSKGKKLTPWNKGKKIGHFENSGQFKKGQPSLWKGVKPSEEVRNKLSESHKGLHAGPKHPQWRGGVSFIPYCHKFNNSLKERIRERDNRTCQLCGAKENGNRLDVHHIHYDASNCNPDLITLCHGCNVKVNHNREHYEVLFMNNLKQRGLV